MSTKAKTCPPDVPLDPPKQYRAPLGEIVLRWSRLEYQLGVIARVAVKLSKADQRRLFLSLRTEQLYRALVVVSAVMPLRVLAPEVRQLALDAQKLNTLRDNYVHSIYGSCLGSPNDPKRFRLKNRRGGEEMIPEPVSVQELSGFSDQLNDLLQRAQDLTVKIKG